MGQSKDYGLEQEELVAVIHGADLVMTPCLRKNAGVRKRIISRNKSLTALQISSQTLDRLKLFSRYRILD